MSSDLLWRQLAQAAVEVQYIIDHNQDMEMLKKFPRLFLDASRWIQAQSTEMSKCYDMQEILRGEVDELSKRVVNYSHAAYDANFQLQRIFCEDKGYSEEYGWPVGDHIPSTMADSILARIAELQRKLEYLTPWEKDY